MGRTGRIHDPSPYKRVELRLRHMKVPTRLALLTGAAASASSPWVRQTTTLSPWLSTANDDNSSSRQSRLTATVSRCTGGAIEGPHNTANDSSGRSSGNSSSDFDDLLVLGRRHALANDDALAVGVFERAVELAPRSAVAKVELGRALVRTGKAGEGFNMLVGAFEIDSLCPGVKDGFQEYYRAEIEVGTTDCTVFCTVVCYTLILAHTCNADTSLPLPLGRCSSRFKHSNRKIHNSSNHVSLGVFYTRMPSVSAALATRAAIATLGDVAYLWRTLLLCLSCLPLLAIGTTTMILLLSTTTV